jgi:hypothetical protein
MRFGRVAASVDWIVLSLKSSHARLEIFVRSHGIRPASLNSIELGSFHAEVDTGF